jgi:hypothetical protein
VRVDVPGLGELVNRLARALVRDGEDVAAPAISVRVGQERGEAVLRWRGRAVNGVESRVGKGRSENTCTE